MSAMSKKHYVAVAAILRNMRIDGSYDERTLERVEDGLAAYFAEDNERFDAAAFAEDARSIKVNDKQKKGFARLRNRDGGMATVLDRVDRNIRRRERAAALREALADA
jgi:hypothetical protein